MHYLYSPLQQYELGRWVQCMNPECAVNGKTIFKMVKISQRLEHETITFTCGQCRAVGVKKVSMPMR